MPFAGLIAAAILSAAPPFTAHPCSTELATAGARCGTVRVPENRSRPRSRNIDLSVIIIPASAERRLPPLFDLEGGPGLADTRNAGFYLTDGAPYHAHRDVVLFDQRGTGASNGLKCPELDAADAAYQPIYPVAAVRRCRAELEKHADLRHYGTSDAVADLDAVRAALGYDRIDLVAQSYGTTLSLRYMAAYPKTVRAAVLVSVAPPSAMVPRYHAEGAERALTALLHQCRSDPACGKAGDPASKLEPALLSLAKIKDAPPRDVFTEKLRSLMYAPGPARRLPFIVRAAAQGNLKPFFEATKPGGPSPWYLGTYLSITCAEGMAQFGYAAAAAKARRTRFDDYRLRRQRDACANWPIAKVSRDFLRLPRTEAAVLMISGGLDPVTPPAWAAQVARALPNGRQVTIAAMGHIFDGLSAVDTCFDPMLLRFYDSGDAKSVDASCVAQMTAPPFKVEP